MKNLEKNNYGNKFGYHTPNKSEKYAQEFWFYIKEDFVDSSWHNDLCDSLWSEDLDISIMFPNSEKSNPEEEEFKNFYVQLNVNEINGMPINLSFNSMEEVIEVVRQLVAKDSNKRK
jgi:hypothetical protein